MLAGRPAGTTELDQLSCDATLTRAERALARADTTVAALCAFDVSTDGVYASGPLWASHPVRDDEPHTARAYVCQAHAQWPRPLAGQPREVG
ncbi:hypothetical protein GCM10017667_69560 [Streptomyces filamentosus]|uniref:Uncharacterized protein n=1 Tax=Streptomyces filamentosus TaxID=67294 RepID=A0A919BX25_STRFL|nr:hypothetical protein GCM10017667_69560 [Streptomyces filamentosus]